MSAQDNPLVMGVFVACVNGRISQTLIFSEHDVTEYDVTTDGRPPAIFGDIERSAKQSEGSSFNNLKGSLKGRLRSCPQEGLKVEMFKETSINPDRIKSRAPRWMPSDVHEWVKDCASPAAWASPIPEFKVIVIKMAAN